MTELDDRFEAHLVSMETGAADPWTKIQADEELTGLFSLAAAVRELEKPSLAPQKARSIRSTVLDSVQKARLEKAPAQKTWWRRPALAGAFLAAAFAAVVFTVFVAGLVWRFAVNSRPVVAFQDQAGIVEIFPADEGAGWTSANARTRLEPGSRIRTGPGSTATLRFADGSTTHLAASTELALTTLAKEGDAIQIELTQGRGKTSHQVSDLADELAYFLVNTPGGTAQVRGTSFRVTIDKRGASTIQVGSGQVNFLAAGKEISLKPGQVTTVLPGAAPTDPAYSFTGMGEVQSIVGTEWTIGGVPINVVNQTAIYGSPVVGDFVRVSGRVLADGLWLADEIAADSPADSFFSFTGVLESNQGNTWLVSGFPLIITPETTLDPDLQTGEPVEARFFVTAAGAWQALAITRLEDIPEEPDPTPAPTPDPEAQPSLSFTPDELEETACSTTYRFTGTLLNTGDPPDDYAAHVRLGYSVIKGNEFVESVLIEPTFWETIPGGAQVEVSITLNLLEAWLQAPDEAEVKLRLFIADEINRPDGHPTRLTLTAIQTCGATPVPTTPPPTEPTPTPTPSPTPDPGEGATCTGNDPHPTGARLASRYGVPYQEIMGWFCSGFGFGEIELAYDLQLETGTPVQQIFNMRRSGMGWGNIKKELNPKPNGKPPKDK